MKLLPYIYILLFPVYLLAEKPLEKDTYISPPIFRKVEGTNLTVYDVNTRSTTRNFNRHVISIGRNVFSEDRKESTFTPILSFPSVDNDEYVVTYRDGKIYVSYKKAKTEVLTIYLKYLDQNYITPNQSVEPTR